MEDKKILTKQVKELKEELKKFKEELRIERARNANSTFERATTENQLENIEIQRLKNANEVLNNENKDLKEKLKLEIEKSDKLTLDFNAWRVQNLPIPEHPLESTRIDPLTQRALRPTQRNLDSSSSEKTLNFDSGSSVGANQEHAANKNAQKDRKDENRFEMENRQLQKSIEDLQKHIQEIEKERSEDRRKIEKLEEKIVEVEEINAEEVENRRSVELELEMARRAYESRPPAKKSKECCKTLLKRKEIETTHNI